MKCIAISLWVHRERANALKRGDSGMRVGDGELSIGHGHGSSDMGKPRGGFKGYFRGAGR